MHSGVIYGSNIDLAFVEYFILCRSWWLCDTNVQSMLLNLQSSWCMFPFIGHGCQPPDFAFYHVAEAVACMAWSPICQASWLSTCLILAAMAWVASIWVCSVSGFWSSFLSLHSYACMHSLEACLCASAVSFCQHAAAVVCLVWRHSKQLPWVAFCLTAAVQTHTSCYCISFSIFGHQSPCICNYLYLSMWYIASKAAYLVA